MTASAALHTATTSRTAMTAMAAIAAAVQHAVAYLVTAQWVPTSFGAGVWNPSVDAAQWRESRRAGASNTASTAAAAAGGSNYGSGGGVPPVMNGTRLLVVLWACMAQVQQQCMLLSGRPAFAEALASAAKDVEYIDASADDVEVEEKEAEEESPGRTAASPSHASTSQKQTPSKSPAPRKAATKGKAPLASTSPSVTRSEGAGLAGETAAATVSPSSPVPVELRHAHPAVAHLAGQFPRMALDVILHLVGVVETSDAVPHAPPYQGSSSSSGKHAAKYGEGAAGQDGVSLRRFNDTSERRATRGARQRTSISAYVGDVTNAGLGLVSGAGACYPTSAAATAAALRLRALQCVYRGCVEALEVLLHAAAVKSTSAAESKAARNAAAAAPLQEVTYPPSLQLPGALTSATAAGGEWQQSFSPLSTLTYATVWHDAVDVLGYCDETETEGDVMASRGCGALHDGQTTPPLRHARLFSPAAAPNSAAPSVCCLYNPSDTRCVLRWISWEALFNAVDGDAAATEKGAGLFFTPKSLVEAGVVRAVTALRTLAFASPRLAVAVRVGLSMESWWRAQFSSSIRKNAAGKSAGNTPPADITKKGARAEAATLRAAASTSVECALRCIQLLRVLPLAVMLHQSQRHHAQQQQQQQNAIQKESPLMFVMRHFQDAAYALDTVTPLSPAPSSSSDSSSAREARHSGESLAPSDSPLPLVAVHSGADDYAHLAAEAQASLQLSSYQRRALSGVNGYNAVALREYYEREDMNDAQTFTDEAWSPLPSSMGLYKVAAVLVERVVAALCPAVDESQRWNSGFMPPSPPCVTLLLRPITTDAGSLLLRCGEALRAQWQQQRTRRLLQQGGHETTAASTEDAVAAAARDPSRVQEELEAREESHYATIVSCALSFLWRSNSGGAPQLDERGVTAVTRRASAGFLQLLPSETAERGAAMSYMAPVQLSRRLAHGATVRRLLELTRAHLQDHVESLLWHAAAVAAAPHGGVRGDASHTRSVFNRLPQTKNSSPITAAQQASQRRALVAARDGLTELTHTWVTVRWQLARLQTLHADYAARHLDLETLQQRHDQQQIYGRPTAKELRILRTLEEDAPLLPTTAKDEEVRLKRWVKDQQHTAAGSVLANSSQLLQALVCAALVPLNSADPSAQQKLVDEAVRVLTDVEKNAGNETPHQRGSDAASRSSTAQQQQQAPRYAQEPLVIYTPILLWCYLAEACSRCGTAEQTALVRSVLDHHLLRESPEVRTASPADTVLTTAPFVQRLLLQPRWSSLEDCSPTTRMAFCRALRMLASRSTSSSSSALSSLQSAYRVLLALQIQQLPDPSAVTSTTLLTAQHGTDRMKSITSSLASGSADSPQRHTPSSKFALSSAQQLLSFITEYLSRSGDTATSHGGSPAAALLLPLLVELCSVLLHLPSAFPQWADGEIQLFALRVLTLFKQQQLALLTASPSPLTVGATNTTAGAAAAMMDVFLQLLWTTFAHVWNSVFRNPNPRQRRFLHSSTAATQWARRVFDQHRLNTQQPAVARPDEDSGEHGDDEGKSSTSRRARSSSRKRGSSNQNASAGGAPAPDAAVPSVTSVIDSALPLNFVGVAYLPESDDGSHHHQDEERSVATSSPAVAGAGEGESPERHRASPPATKIGSTSNARSNSCDGSASLPTVSLHARMPCEYVELLEDILFHMPPLWTCTMAPPGAAVIPAVAAAPNRNANDTSFSSGKSTCRVLAPQVVSATAVNSTAVSENEGMPRMQTQYDFASYAALQAAQALRESQRSTGSTSTTGEPKVSVLASGQLYGLPPIYMEVVAALQLYDAAMINSNSNTTGSSGNSNGVPLQGASSSTSAAAAAAAGARGGVARLVNSAAAVPAVSAACLALLETLNKYREDPNYAKLSMHVVRQMLAFCNDDSQSGPVGGGMANAAGGTGGASTGSNNRKKTPAGGGAEGGFGGGVGGRSFTGVSAAAVTVDVRHVIRSVREQIHENHNAIRSFLASVDAETEVWLTRGGFSLAGQVQQQQQNHSPQGSLSSGAHLPPAAATAATAAAADAGGAGKTKAAAASARKTGKRGLKKRGGGRGRKANASASEQETDEDDASPAGDEAPSTGVPYTKVKCVFSFMEEQKLKQLTCAVARWRRSRAGRLLRQRYVQFNTPYLAQLHLIEAALLHMGATMQRDAAKQKLALQGPLALTEGSSGGAQAASAGGAAYASFRVSPRDKKKATCVCPPANSRDGADAEDPPSATEELLRHCVQASNLFENLWLPARIAAAVQLAVSHLQKNPLPLTLSPTTSSPSPSHDRRMTGPALVTQLLAAPLFCLAAVQHGYCDARRDVHNCVLQPVVIKVGAEVSWSHRDDFVSAVPSLFTLASAVGQRSEQQMAHRAGAQAKRQRRYELLQLSWCVEEEAETRVEAIRDELQERVRIIQQAQHQLLPITGLSPSLKARLVSAADLLALVPERKRTKNFLSSMGQKRAAEESVSTAAQPNRAAVHAIALGASNSLPYSPFEGMRGAVAAPQGDGGLSSQQSAVEVATTRRRRENESISPSPSAPHIDAACYGPDLSEACLISQLLSLAQMLEHVSPKTCAAAYRVAQKLTNGRCATELLPRLMRVEEDGGCGRDAVAATLKAYEQALRSVSDGAWLLRSARMVRRQWSASPRLPKATMNHNEKSAKCNTSVSSAMSWKAVVEAYQRAAQALRAAGLLQPLGECLYELGNVYAAATRMKEAERNWKDALDCLLSTPHVFHDWHTQRSVPPLPFSTSSPSSSCTNRGGVEELLWMTAALTSLAERAYAADASRATDAQLLCALLVHRYWRLPAVVEGGGSNSKDPARWSSGHGTALPYSAYNQLDVASLSATSTAYSDGKASRGSPSQRVATEMPDDLSHIVRALTNAAHLLVQSHFSNEAAVLGAFSDFMATIHLQQVELTVEARLVRATAAAELGSFSASMRHLHSVCVGAGLPQPVRGVLGVDNLPGYYSIASAAAAAAAARQAGASSLPAAPGVAKKTAAGVGTLTGGGGGGGVNGGAGGGSASAAASAGGALSPCAAATVLPASVAALFHFYRDHESPSSPHNTAAIPSFVLACLPGLAVDAVTSVSAPTSRQVAATSALPLVGRLLPSAALESRYGVCLLRKLYLAIAEVLVRLGTCDPVYLFRSPPSLSSLPRAVGGSEGGGSGAASTEPTTPAPTLATTTGSGTSSVIRRCTSASGGGGGGHPRLSLSSPSPLLPFMTLATGERPTNACTEACRYAQLLLNSLCSTDVRFIMVGQPSTVGAVAGAGVETDGATTSRSTRVPGETVARSRTNTTSGDVGRLGSEPVAAAAAAAALVQGPAGEVEHDGAALSADSVRVLNTLGAISQWAVLLTGEVLAAQGQYTACLQLLTSIIAEYNDVQAGPSQPATGAEGEQQLLQSPQPKSASATDLLRRYGLQSNVGGSSGTQSGVSLPFNFTYVYWMRVWRLMCRCYSPLRQYVQLENAARAQGLRLCDAFGDTSTQRPVFQLYRLYALTQMGQLKEAADVAADMQREGVSCMTPSQGDAAAAVDSEAAGILDDGSVAAALRWWKAGQRSTGESPWSSTLSFQRLVTQLLKGAVAERGVLPWRALSPSQPVVALASPDAHAVVPLCPLSGCAKTRDLWRLHYAMNHYAFELQWQMLQGSPFSPPSIPSTLEKRREKGSGALASVRRPQQPLGGQASVNASGSGRNSTPPPGSISTDSLPISFAPNPNASLLLREALEAVCTQYTTQAHPGHWLESRLLLTRIKARGVCDMLNARHQHNENSATVEFALHSGVSTPDAAAEPSRAVPILSSRDAALRALPTPVREVCEELLSTLQLFIEFFVQRHALLRVILLDLAAVLSTYISDVRTRRQRDAKRGALATEVALLPQFEATVAACVLLAGLVSDMERRVRTGAECFRGYFTDPRLASTESCDALAALLQSQWPESLCTAVQQTHDNVGQLQIVSTRANAHCVGSGTSPSPVEAISHPFYTLPSVQQQLFGSSAASGYGTAASGGASGAASAGNNSSGRCSSAGNRDQGAASSTGGFKRGGAAAAQSATAAAAASESSTSPLLSVPTLALTFTTLTDEAAAVQALTPVATVLEHDTAVQLLTSHLQSLSPPINCTYLCYRDDTRYQLLKAIGAVLIQQQQLQQPPQRGAGGQSRGGNMAAKRPGTMSGPAGSSQVGFSAPGSAMLNFTEADVWKALLPPVLLSAIPADLFSAVGPDTLGAPLYNSVAAAAVSVPVRPPSSLGKRPGQSLPAAAGGGAAGRRHGESTAASWLLLLAVSPLQDASITEAPGLTSSASSTAPASVDTAVLLPPANLVAAANGGGINGNAGSDGAAGAMTMQGASMPQGGGTAGGGSSGVCTRGRGNLRPSGVGSNNTANTFTSPHRSSEQDSAMGYAGSSGTIWPPALSSTSSRAACLVPSTNWMFLDHIRQEGLSLLPSRIDESAAMQLKGASSATGSRTHVASKATRGIHVAATAAGTALSPSAVTTSSGPQERAKAPPLGSLEPSALGPAALRWRSVSLVLSDSTVQMLRRHLRTVQRCLYRVKEVGVTADTADPVNTVVEVTPLAKVSSTSFEVAKADADSGPGENSTRSALAAAVSRAQQTLRSHLAASGVAMNATNGVGSGGGAGLGLGGIGGTSYAPTASATAGGSLAATGSNAPAASANSATGNAAPTLRKTVSRIGGINISVNTSVNNNAAHATSSGNNTDPSLPAQAAGAPNENSAMYDDLAEAVRCRQTAERERQREQYAEELDEAVTSFLRELLEAIVSAVAGSGPSVAAMDETRVELEVQRLMPRCALSPAMVDFLCEWLGGISAATADGDEGEEEADAADYLARSSASYSGSSFHTSLCFYNAGLHEWMQRIAQYLAGHHQQ
ncbi:hypothetical protein ABL78_2481 [Leptomonas seymouri]|uniref:Uncharacterized protein n=1 Tax=Leptomonas seymouri TaxID=5684 RepID=A0A0N0P757_LEPSE|nr:hypothetical protein ABL78_2481 [Leptomonas seymouri]|eukprot:KPI88416.1 hypothetical protein ABL78_2481 [Leptomonas seymouri]